MALTKIPASFIDTSSGISGDMTFSGNLTLTGYLAGPATFTIDPAGVGDNTGTVVIAGNLQVDGTTTTINSTTMTVDDLNITLASGAANAAAADGAGITVDGANASFTYSSGDNSLNTNVSLNIGSSSDTVSLRLFGDDPDIRQVMNTSSVVANLMEHSFSLDTSGNLKARIYYDKSNDEFAFQNITSGNVKISNTAGYINIDSSGNVGIGTVSPGTELDVVGEITGTRLHAASATPLVSINDTNATNDTDLVGYVSFQNQGVERAYVGFGSQGNDRFLLQRVAGDIELLASNGNVLVPQGSFGVGFADTDTLSGKFEVKRTYSPDDRAVIISNGPRTTGTTYDTVVINQTDVPSIRLIETQNSQELSFAVGDENSNSAVIGATGKIVFSTGRTAGQSAYSYTSPAMVIEASGNLIGMGTSSPQVYGSKGLEVSGPGQTGIRISNTLATGKGVEIGADSTGGYIQTVVAGSKLGFYTGAASPLVMELDGNSIFTNPTKGLGYLYVQQGSGVDGGILWSEDSNLKWQNKIQSNDGLGWYDYSDSKVIFQLNPSDSIFTDRPIYKSQEGAKVYSHLCARSLYNGSGAVVIQTNIPAFGTSGDANMFSIKIRGYTYDDNDGGQIDFNIGCYSGESNFYNVSHSGSNIPNQWIDNLVIARNNSTGKVAIILGEVTNSTPYVLAVTDFVQGFQNPNSTYAVGWSIDRETSLSGYSDLRVSSPVYQQPKHSFHVYAASSFTISQGVYDVALTGVAHNRDGLYNTSTGRFTAQNEGSYLFTYAIQLSTSSTNYTYLSAEARVNGSTRYIGGWFSNPNKNTNTGYDAATGSAVIYLNRGDYVEFVYESSTTLVALGGSPGYTYLSGAFLG